jgi:hypothetical protein
LSSRQVVSIMVQHEHQLGEVVARGDAIDQVLQGVPHRPGFRMAGIEEHQHQVGQIDDVIGQL